MYHFEIHSRGRDNTVQRVFASFHNKTDNSLYFMFESKIELFNGLLVQRF